MQKAYRIVQPKFIDTAFDGEGSFLFGGRWNKKGVRVVYTSSSPSLAVLENFVHMGIEMNETPYRIFEINIPKKLISSIKIPSNWNENPVPSICMEIGSSWVKTMKSAVLEVPSTVMQLEKNYILNPLHPDFKEIVIHKAVEFVYDERMWKVH